MSTGAYRTWVLLLSIFAAQPALHAAEAEPAKAPSAPGQTDTATPEASPDDASPDAAPPPQEDGAQRPASEDVFVPTVEVSEDTSVPFPVDI